jgi:flagellar hook assembly protein FlgD
MNLNLHCHPNPANSMITINWESNFSLDTEIKIYNILGRLIFEKKIISTKGDNSFDWLIESQNYNTIPSGIYLLEVKTINSSDLKKITYLK